MWDEVGKKLRTAREKAGLSLLGAVEATGVGELRFRDMEACDDLFFCALLTEVFAICRVCQTSPEELWAEFVSDRSCKTGSPEELIRELMNRANESPLPLHQVWDHVGWDIDAMGLAQQPGKMLQQNVDCLRDICLYIEWDWLACLQRWYEQSVL